MHCSCPDWAVPCKHLAAVIYMVCREIDNNPFLVFEMHNVQLMEEMRRAGLFLGDSKVTDIPQWLDILKPNQSKLPDYESVRAYQRVDLSYLQPIAEPLIQLLPDAPPFYPLGNFKDKYARTLLKIIRDVQRFLKNKPDADALFASRKSLLPLNHRSTVSLVIDASNDRTVEGEHHNCLSWSDLMVALIRLNPEMLPDYQPSVVASHRVLSASLHLLAYGAVVPQMVQLPQKGFFVRWLPAMIDGRVQQLVEHLKNVLPPDLLLVKQTVRKKVELLPIEDQVVVLLSTFLTRMVAEISVCPDNDLFLEMFFKNKEHSFKGVAESALSGGVKSWLDRYYITADFCKPMLMVQELEGECFALDVAFLGNTGKEADKVSLKEILTKKSFERQRFAYLQTLSLLSSFIRGLDFYIDHQGARPMVYNRYEFAPFLMDVMPAIRLLDVQVVLPKSLQTLLRPKPSVRLKRVTTVSSSFVRLDDLLSFDWQVAIGDDVLSPDEYEKLTHNAAGLLKFKGNYIYASEADMEKLFKRFSQSKSLNSFQILQVALSEEYRGAPVALTDEVRSLIKELTSNENVELPVDLLAHMRPYQIRGFSWMYRNSKIGFGSMIADDMGLGKTLQVIAVLLKFKEENAFVGKHKAMVVAPTGLLTNWQSEFEKFAPSLSTFVYHGHERNLNDFRADVLLTTYGMVRNESEQIKKLHWLVLVIDEAQNIKNYGTAQSKAIKGIGATVRIAMSGTPVENRLSDFWSIMDFSNKGYLGTVKSFQEEYAEPIQELNDEQAALRFRKVTAPFMMRRMKSDKSIISDLPDKIDQNQWALLTKEQVALYDKTLQVAMSQIEDLAEGDDTSLFKRQGLVLQMILALKQICNHPTQYLKNGVFDASLSGKTGLLLELLASISETSDKVLIFTQFREMGEMLQRFIAERFGEEPMFYHGGCSVAQRNDMVHRFQSNRADKFFLLSLKAAGTGLNLTAASHVIHYDLWWNPAVEQQATDRAFRIGQTKNVMVHRFITKNTFEERIDEMIQQKKHLADMTVSTGENWIGKLSNKELRALFSGR